MPFMKSTEDHLKVLDQVPHTGRVNTPSRKRYFYEERNSILGIAGDKCGDKLRSIKSGIT